MTERPRRAPSGWGRIVGRLFVAAAFVFLGLVVARDFQALRAHSWTIRPGMFALSLVLQIAGLLWGARIWHLLLRRMGHAMGFLDLARVQLLAGFGRYIPGKIWAFMGAANLGATAGLPAAATVGSLVLHAGLNLIASVLVAAVLLPAGALPPGVRTVLLWAAPPLTLLLVHPRVLALYLRPIRALARDTAAEWKGSWAENAGLVGLFMLGWVLSGVALYAFVLSLTPLPSGSLLPMLGINAGTFVVGTLVFVAPAGLGAKEGAAAALFALYVPGAVAALLAVANRLWSVLAELIAAALLVRFAPGRPRGTTAGADAGGGAPPAVHGAGG